MILTIDSIPTLRSLYRSRRLLQRDQSYAPNDTYNQMISFCYHDITKLNVDAIINSANVTLKISRNGNTLNHAIHRAAGPGLIEEANSKGRLKAGQVELTRGHNLPSKWIIHAARPDYSASKGMGQFNILTECYRSALRMAVNYEFKTIAFPCLGTGGCGFPSRVASRIALQEVREYLDEHRENSFERIIFCVNSAADEQAYMDFFPVFFPPTHGDLDRARTSAWSANYAALAAQALETRTQVQGIVSELDRSFAHVVPDFDANIIRRLSDIDLALASIRAFLLGPEELQRSLGDLNLVCSVLQTLCGSVTETIELAKDILGSGRTHKEIWDEYNSLMRDLHGMDFSSLVADCQTFVQHLDDILTRTEVEQDDMSVLRQTLESYGARQKGQDSHGIRDHLDEVLYAREYTREGVSQAREMVKLHQIPSLAKLYQLGELQAKPTLASPSAIFNHAVYLVREDITRLEVDVMVNSTDDAFQGMGTLDHSVFKKGGFQLREDIKKFGKCQEGDVKLTSGYLLPAKHILHVVPPLGYGKNTKEVLRKIYREVLHTAMSLKATSVAIPSIGTGMLNRPRRDCASLAMEEVKRFLETTAPANLIEKIIFVVYSSSDDFIYKSLLPVYFPSADYAPPIKTNPQPAEGSTQASSSTGRGLFGSIGEAFRNVRFGKQALETSRPIDAYEEHALIGFEAHAKDCTTCKDVERLYREGRHLCDIGYPLAQTLLWYMNWTEDHGVRSKPDKNGQRINLELPTDMYPLSLTLLRIVETSGHDTRRKHPFVVQKRFRDEGIRHEAELEPVTDVVAEEASVPIPLSRQSSGWLHKARAEVATWSNLAQRWDPIYPGDCRILIYAGRVDVRDPDNPKGDHVPLLSLALVAGTTKIRYETTTQLVISGTPRLESVFEGQSEVLFRSSKAVESVKLYEMLREAMSSGAQRTERPPEEQPVASR
jgi:O-acetyl-ADP-ribose deacetylase (regulator of RNase III)